MRERIAVDATVPAEREPGRLPSFGACRLCGGAVTERKPVCVRHIAAMPYVRAVMQENERRAEEASYAVLGRLDRIDVEGSRVQEILELLSTRGWLGYADLIRLAFADVQTGSRMRAARTYVRAIVNAGLGRTIEKRDRQGRTRSILVEAE